MLRLWRQSPNWITQQRNWNNYPRLNKSEAAPLHQPTKRPFQYQCSTYTKNWIRSVKMMKMKPKRCSIKMEKLKSLDADTLCQADDQPSKQMGKLLNCTVFDDIFCLKWYSYCSTTKKPTDGRKQHFGSSNRPLYRDDIFFSGSLARIPQYQSQTSLGYHMSVTRIPTKQDVEEVWKTIWLLNILPPGLN